MTNQKVFIYGKTEATIICTECGKIRKVNVTDIKDIHKPFPVKCGCGFAFNVLFEKRVHYRKAANLTGYYITRLDSDAPLCQLIVENISRSGIGFKTIGRSNIKEGDILKIQFVLDNKHESMIMSNVIVRTVVDGKHIGAEFINPDEHAKKELGFYLMP